MLDRDVLATPNEWLCQKGWNDSDAEPGPPALVRGDTAWASQRDPRFDARMVVQDIGGWNSQPVRMREQEVDLPIACARSIAEVVPGQSAPRLVPLCLDQGSEPLAPAAPPPQPVSASSCLLPLAERPDACRRSSPRENDLRQSLLVSVETGTACRRCVAYRRSACCPQLINDHVKPTRLDRQQYGQGAPGLPGTWQGARRGS